MDKKNSSSFDKEEKTKQLSDNRNDVTDERTSRRSTRPRNVRILQNFLLIWLDANIDEDNDNDCRNIITQLRQVVNTVNTFINIDQCVDFITDIKDEKIFMIVSGELGQTILPIIHDKPQVSFIYILCADKTEHEQWVKQWSKIKGVFTEIPQICGTLEQATRECDRNSISMSFVPTTDDTSNKSLDQLDPSFMYTQILKEILLTIDFNEEHIIEFAAYYREQYDDNAVQLENIDKLKIGYHHHQPIWWYTHQDFLYSTLNRALRTMELDIIIKMGFFLHDLHKDIARLHREQYADYNQSHRIMVYRGQGLSEKDFNQMINTKGGLISFNNFLSTSLDRALSLAFAESNGDNPVLIGVLFQIAIDPSISLIPFANICRVSHFQTEKEILFSMHSVFRIGEMKPIDGSNRLWQVELTLTSDNDPQLSALTKHIQSETLPDKKGWDRLARLLINLGHVNKAQKLYEVLLDQTSDEFDRGTIYHQLGVIKSHQANYEEAIIFYKKSIKIILQFRPPNDSDLANTYGNLGTLYEKMSDYSESLLYHEKALKIRRETFPRNYLDLANSYGNMGSVYEKMGDYTKALEFYEKDLKISLECLPPNHPEVANMYASIGSIYDKKGEYSKALRYCQQSDEIRRKTLPPDHPDLAISYNNIGLIYGKMKKYPEALAFHEKAREIYQKTLSPDHPDMAISYANTGFIHQEIGDSSEALAYYEKASGIFQKTFSSNHPHLANSYSAISIYYCKLGKYLKALPYSQKALEIYQETLLADHPELVAAYTHTGLIYNTLGEYSKSLTCHTKALEVYQKIVPLNLCYLFILHCNIGGTYFKMDEHSKALLFFQQSVAILLCLVPKKSS